MIFKDERPWAEENVAIRRTTMVEKNLNIMETAINVYAILTNEK